MVKRKVVQFGAGNIGRGFLAQLFTQSGCAVVFVEVIPEIINALNKQGSYVLKIVGENPHDVLINDVRAIDGRNKEIVSQEIETAELVATAVGVKYLPTIVPGLSLGIMKRKDKKVEVPLNIIICENLLNAGKILKKLVLEDLYLQYHSYVNEKIGFVESVVSRMIPIIDPETRKKDPLFIMAEEYNILPVDKKGVVGKIPQIKGMVPRENFSAYEEQKLFIHNLGHAASAYFGYLEGYRFIWETMEDDKVKAKVKSVLKESGEALNRKHNFSEEEQNRYIQDLLKRFANRALGDTIARVGRDPLRKLGPNDRLIGGAKLALEYGIEPENICLAIGACLNYDNPEDKEAVELKSILETKGLDSVLEEVCEIKPESKLGQMIKAKYKEVRYLKQNHSM